MGALSMTAFFCLTVKNEEETPDTDQNTERPAGENISVKEETRTVTQDIRPLQILVLNP